MYILVHTFLVLYFIAKAVSTGSKFSSIFPYQFFIFLYGVGFNCMLCIHADTEHNIVIMVSLFWLSVSLKTEIANILFAFADRLSIELKNYFILNVLFSVFKFNNIIFFIFVYFDLFT